MPIGFSPRMYLDALHNPEKAAPWMHKHPTLAWIVFWVLLLGQPALVLFILYLAKN